MRLSRPRPALALLAATAMLAVAACGGSNSSSNNSGSTGKKTGSPGRTGNTGGTSSGGGGANVGISQGQKKGGTLNVVSAEAWEHLDPGQSYFQIDYLVVYATQRPLYSFTPD